MTPTTMTPARMSQRGEVEFGMSATNTHSGNAADPTVPDTAESTTTDTATPATPANPKSPEDAA